MSLKIEHVLNHKCHRIHRLFIIHEWWVSSWFVKSFGRAQYRYHSKHENFQVCRVNCSFATAEGESQLRWSATFQILYDSLLVLKKRVLISDLLYHLHLKMSALYSSCYYSRQVKRIKYQKHRVIRLNNWMSCYVNNYNVSWYKINFSSNWYYPIIRGEKDRNDCLAR